MHKDNINYLAVGSFVLAMLILLMVSLYHITGKGVDTDKYYVVYHNVTGINEGSAVTYGGFEVGKILEVIPQRANNETSYRLTLGVRSGWPIPEDSTAQIVSPSILAEKQIDIKEGKSNTLLQSEGMIKGIPAIDMMAIMNMVSGEFNDIAEGNIRPLINKIASYLDNIGNDLNNNVPKITENTAQLLATLNQSALRLNEILSQDNQQQFNNLLVNTHDMSESLLTLTQHLNKTGDQVDRLLTNSNAMLDDNGADIRHAVIDLHKTLDVLSGSINSIVHNLDATSRNMNEFTRELRRNPSVLISSKPATDSSQE
ncbi:MAG: MlaD family protein [Gammaproteobacteria bacterium]|nr:MlaD family protein [Gammaproteobacteria bacterium]